MRYLVTGTAGFIGFHLAKRLLDEGHDVVGVDAFTPYYDVSLKERRNDQLIARNRFKLHRLMLEDNAGVAEVWKQDEFDAVIHLAAQAGVRYSIENPRAYIDTNLVGTFNVIEQVQAHPLTHFMLASTSSVYGSNVKQPFEETDRTDHQISLYAATKKATEGMAHAYSNLWKIPTTVFRFFSVYGPWGRPDMALFKFTQGILEDRPIDVYNGGQMQRDFTYIDDLVHSIYLLSLQPPREGHPIESACVVDSLSPVAPYRVVNIGGGTPVNLLDFIDEIESALGRKSRRNYMPMMPGDVACTIADSDLLEAMIGYRPDTPVKAGVRSFVDWYCNYYGVKQSEGEHERA